MKPFEIIPAIDLIHGQVVRLTQGDYAQMTHYAVTPEEIARRYEAAGAKRIHIVDLDGAKAGQLMNFDAIKKIRQAVSCELEVGGGIRTQESIRQLYDTGITYMILGSVLIRNFEQAKQWIAAYPNAIIAGVDTKNGVVAVSGWQEASPMSAKEIILQLNPLPLAGVIFTDIARDGMLMGPNIELLQEVAGIAKMPVIASGGVSSLADIESVRELYALGVSGCIIGKAILNGAISMDALWPK